MVLTIDRKIYSDECVTKAVYSLSARYVVRRSLHGDTETLVIDRADGCESVEQTEHTFLMALDDYKLREMIERETHDIRTILYAKAFADCDEL